MDTVKRVHQRIQTTDMSRFTNWTRMFSHNKKTTYSSMFHADSQEDILLEPLQGSKVRHYGANDILVVNPLEQYHIEKEGEAKSRIPCDDEDTRVNNDVNVRQTDQICGIHIGNISAEHVPGDKHDTIVLHVDLHLPPTEQQRQQIAAMKLSGSTMRRDEMAIVTNQRRFGMVQHEPLHITHTDSGENDIPSNEHQIVHPFVWFGHKPSRGDPVPIDNTPQVQIIGGHEQIPLKLIHHPESTPDDPRGLYLSSLQLEKTRYTHPISLEKCPQQKKKETQNVIKFTKDMVLRMEVQALIATVLAMCLWLPPPLTTLTFKLHMCACIMLMTCSSIIISLICAY